MIYNILFRTQKIEKNTFELKDTEKILQANYVFFIKIFDKLEVEKIKEKLLYYAF